MCQKDEEKRDEENLILYQKAIEGDSDALEQLCDNMEPVMLYVYNALNCSQSIHMSEIMQIGKSAVNMAVLKFDVKKGRSFGKYCFYWIKNFFREEMYSRLVPFHVPLYVYRQKSKCLRAMYDIRREKDDGEEVTNKEIAERTGMSERVVRNRMMSPTSTSVEHLDREISSEESGATFFDLVSDSNSGLPSDDIEVSMAFDYVKSVCDRVLKDRENEMVMHYFGITDGDPKTFKEISKMYNLTSSRIEQIIKKAIHKIKKEVNENGEM